MEGDSPRGTPGRSWIGALQHAPTSGLAQEAVAARAALDRGSPSVAAFVTLALHAQRHRRHRPGVEPLEQAQELAPGAPHIKAMRAWLLVLDRRPEEVGDLVDEALATAPHDPDVVLYAALASGGRKDPGRGLALLDSVANASADLLWARATVLLTSGVPHNAEEPARAALALDPGHVGAGLVLLMTQHLQRHDPEELRMSAEALLALDPEHPEVRAMAVATGYTLAGLEMSFLRSSPARWYQRTSLAGMALVGFGLGVGFELLRDPIRAGILGAGLMVPVTLLVFGAMKRSMVRRVARRSKPIAEVFRTESRASKVTRLVALVVSQCASLGVCLSAISVYVSGWQSTPLLSAGLCVAAVGLFAMMVLGAWMLRGQTRMP